MTPEQKEKILKLPDVEIMSRTIYGEARNQEIDGMVAVANVILNRDNDPMRRYGSGIVSICLRDKQFSCWNDGDPNLPVIMNPGSEIYTSRIIASLAVKSLLCDNTDGSNLYHYSGMINFPYWSSSKGVFRCKQIGDHIFYREV